MLFVISTKEMLFSALQKVRQSLDLFIHFWVSVSLAKSRQDI
jgi:hypothetical protein